MSIRKSTAKARIRRPAADARENILAAAEKILVEQGPLALKLSEVAAAAQVVNATVLHHFGSIDGVHTALMDRMIRQLVDQILAARPTDGDAGAHMEAVVQTLFDVFETRGAARLAAWLELTGEWRRLTVVREAVREVVAERMARGDLSAAEAEDLVLISVVLAMGAGLFGRSLATLIGKPENRSRKLVADMLRAHVAARMAD